MFRPDLNLILFYFIICTTFTDPNARFRVIDPIKPWQNEVSGVGFIWQLVIFSDVSPDSQVLYCFFSTFVHQRLLELLLSMLCLTEPIGALTNELANMDKKRTLVVHPVLGSGVNGPSIQRVAGLKRTLQDQWKTTRKYEKILDKANRERANAPVGGGRDANRESSANNGRLIGMAEADQKDHGGDRIVDIPQFRRLARALRPDFRISNLSYHREEESPRAARARRNAGVASSAPKKKKKLGSKEQAKNDLDNLFDRKMKSSAYS